MNATKPIKATTPLNQVPTSKNKRTARPTGQIDLMISKIFSKNVEPSLKAFDESNIDLLL